MKWEVEGADEKTGLDVTVTFEARSLGDAMDMARANGILPADGYPAGSRKPKAPPLSYASPTTPNHAPAAIPTALAGPHPALAAVPDYKPIVEGAKWLGKIAAMLYAGAILCWIGAAFLVVAWLAETAGERRESENLVLALDLLLRGFWSMVGGAVVRMLAHLALAVRDIARNSWR